MGAVYTTSSVSNSSTFRFTHYEARSLPYLLSDCLRLKTRIAPSHPKLAIGDADYVLPNQISASKLHDRSRPEVELSTGLSVNSSQPSPQSSAFWGNLKSVWESLLKVGRPRHSA